MVGALFVATGAVGLVTEQVFEKLLSTVVGASTPAGAIVLAVYFVGLTLGALGYPLAVARIRRPLLLYALLEAGVGAWALLLAATFPWLQALGGQVVGMAGDSRAALMLLRLLVAAAWILPPTVAMGMSFPAVVGVLERSGIPGLHRRMARLYSLNLVGAALGAAAAPYLLFPKLGLVGALLLAAGLEVAVVAIALSLVRSRGDREPGEDPATAAGASWAQLLGRPAVRWLALAACWSGFAIFGLEVCWLHLVGSVCGTSVYAFGNMLLAVLLGLLLGGLLVSAGRDGGEPLPLAALVGALLVSAWLLLLSRRLWDDLPGIFAALGDQVHSFAAGEAVRVAACLLLVGLPSLALGTVYPLLFRLRGFPGQQADACAGLLAAANALGCMAGALLTGFVLIPRLGSERTLGLLCASVLAVGLLVLLLAAARSRGPQLSPLRRPLLAAQGLLGLLAVAALAQQPAWDRLALTSGANVYFRSTHVFEGSELIFWNEDSFGGFTTVVENEALNGERWRVLLTNGKFEGNDVGERPAQAAFALLPPLHSPGRSRALIVGMGTGHTARLAADAGYEAVELVELAPGIVGAATKSFDHVNQRVLEHPAVRLFLEDGRNHLLRNKVAYDMVSIEITSVWFAGASNLYSREFYRLVRDRLAPDGVLAQWIQLHHLAPEEVLSVVATLQESFEHVGFWQVGGQGAMLASRQPLQLRASALDELRQRPELEEALRLLEQRHGPGLAFAEDTVVLTPPELRARMDRALVEGTPINTDGNRYLEYSTPRHNLEQRDHRGEILGALMEGLPAAERAERLARLGD